MWYCFNKMKTFGNKIDRMLDILEKYSPEKMDQKVMNILDNIFEETSKDLPKTNDNESTYFSGESIFWMTFLGLTTFGFCYLVYLMIF